MGGPARPLHEPGNHRSSERCSHRHSADCGSLIEQPTLLRIPLLHHRMGHDPAKFLSDPIALAGDLQQSVANTRAGFLLSDPFVTGGLNPVLVNAFRARPSRRITLERGRSTVTQMVHN